MISRTFMTSQVTIDAFLHARPFAGEATVCLSRELTYPPVHLALLDGYIFLRIGRPNVIGAGADQAIVVELLDDVGGPAADSREGKYRSEQIYVNPQRVIGGCGVEIHIGVEFFLSLHKFFDLAGHLEPLALAAALPQIAGHFAQVRGPRIFGVIDAMSEAW